MTRKARLTRLEGAQTEKIGPDDVIGVYWPDPEAGVFIDRDRGRTLPMSAEQRADAEAAFASLAQPVDEDDPPRVTFRIQIAPLPPRAPKRPR